jgi:hypothetical protein
MIVERANRVVLTMTHSEVIHLSLLAKRSAPQREVIHSVPRQMMTEITLPGMSYDIVGVLFARE